MSHFSEVTANAGTNLNTSALSLEAGGNLATTATNTNNLDVALSTRLKPADTLAAVTTVTTVGAVTNVTNPVAVTNANLDIPLSTLLQPADTLTAVTTVGTITNPVGMKWVDTTNTANGFINNAGAPQICSQDYLMALAEGDIENHTPFAQIGYTPAMTTSISDVWDVGGTYVFPTAEAGLEVVSTNNTDDIGTAIFTGTDTGGGTTTSLVDTGADFTAGTPAAAGDVVILDKSGTTPEWGYVTAVAANTLTVAGGFSSGGTASGRGYHVIDTGATAGAQAVMLDYLDDDFAEKTEICIMNGTTEVPTVNTDIYRINAFKIVAVGANGIGTGTISLRNLADTPVYARITIGYTSARNSIYTVPADKAIYIVEFNLAYGYTINVNHNARMFARAKQAVNGIRFRTQNLFYVYGETVCSNMGQFIQLQMPIKFVAGVDIKISGISTYTGTAVTAMRGWMENE